MWEPLQGGAIVIHGMSNVVKGIGAVCAAALGYLMGKAIANQINQTGGSTYTSGTGGNTADPPAPSPDPNSDEGIAIELGLNKKDWTRWYEKGLVQESLRDNPN